MVLASRSVEKPPPADAAAEQSIQRPESHGRKNATPGSNLRRRKNGQLKRTLDAVLQPRGDLDCPLGRGIGKQNVLWTAEADALLTDLCGRYGPTKAKSLFRRKALDFLTPAPLDGTETTDAARKVIERRMDKLGLPTGAMRKPAQGHENRKWKPDHVTALLGSIGSDASIETIASRTGHTVNAVRAKLARLRYSADDIPSSPAFTVDELATLLQVPARRVRGWKERGWLTTKDRRIPTEELKLFVAKHSEQIAFDSLPRETQVYLMDIGYPSPQTTAFRKVVRSTLDDLGKDRKSGRRAHRDDRSDAAED